MQDTRAIEIDSAGDHWLGSFFAMACPCEILVERGAEEGQAQALIHAAAQCAWRIEDKFSRYRTDNIVHAINTSGGKAVVVDEETGNLLDFAAKLTELSAGRFDITSGVLRRAWTFDGGSRVPAQSQLDELLLLVGWHRVEWRRPELRLQPNMQIDFGGIGKEYAVDTAVKICEDLIPGCSVLVNFGGDLAVRNARRNGKPWRVGIEATGQGGAAIKLLDLARGGLATSGDSRRFVLKDGRRYSHILDAQTGWPVPDAPRSITVIADTCTQAGTLATLAMLQGVEADRFLQAQGIRHWIQ